jgi:hypothetical protein
MIEKRFTFTFDEDYRVQDVKALPGATQKDAVKAMSVLSRMRKAVEDLRPTLPLN